MLKVSVESIPCDMDDSDDYLLISVVEDNENESEKADPTPDVQSAKKSPVLRSKSSPQKPKQKVEEDEEEPSSLTRSYSGPIIRQGHRPRSNAIVENRLSTR